MIDVNTRKKFSENQKGQNFLNGVFQATAEAIELKKGTNELMDRVDNSNKEISSNLNIIARNLVSIYKIIPKSISLPKIFNVTGKVEVIKTPPVEISNLDKLTKEVKTVQELIRNQKHEKYPTSFVVDNLFEIKTYFDSLEKRLSDVVKAISSVPQQKIEIPKFEFPKQLLKTKNQDNSEIIESLNRMEQTFVDIGNEIVNTKVKFPKTISVDNFPVQMVPQPVTHISINALEGFIHTSDNTVGTSLTPLPSYGVLANRRSVLIYNNSANTIYIGGSDLTTSNGMPVPANSYSPILDAGINVIMYGIATTANNDVRCLEISDTAAGS